MTGINHGLGVVHLGGLLFVVIISQATISRHWQVNVSLFIIFGCCRVKLVADR